MDPPPLELCTGKKTYLTGEAGGPGGRNTPDAAGPTRHVPVGLGLVVDKVEGAVGTGVAGAGEEGHRLTVPVRDKATLRGRL
jgi:hypothetical protein